MPEKALRAETEARVAAGFHASGGLNKENKAKRLFQREVGKLVITNGKWRTSGREGLLHEGTSVSELCVLCLFFRTMPCLAHCVQRFDAVSTKAVFVPACVAIAVAESVSADTRSS